MSKKRNPSNRRRGAQAGNLNAVRHGFYSRRLLPPEQATLDAAPPIDLTPEIELLRKYGQELLAASADLSSMAESIQAANTVAQLSTVINRLARTQFLLNRLAPSLNNPPTPELPEVK